VNFKLVSMKNWVTSTGFGERAPVLTLREAGQTRLVIVGGTGVAFLSNAGTFLETLHGVYQHDALARKRDLLPQDRYTSIRSTADL
jgi:hypothetical protein